MKVQIQYCVQWNYLPRASRLAAELKERFRIDPELVRGNGGVFEIIVDGAPVFSKRSLGRFPEDGEVARMIVARNSE